MTDRPSRPRLARYLARRLPLHALALLLTVTSAAAQAPSGRWTLGAEGIYLAPNDDRAALPPAGSPAASTYGLEGDGLGFGITLDLRVTRHLSVELGLASVDLDVSVRRQSPGGTTADSDSAAFDLYLAGAQWHPFPDRRLDLALGVVVAMTKLDDVRFPTGDGGSGTLTFDDDYGFGLSVGADWPLSPGGRWLLRGDVRYLRTILESDSGASDLDLDPLLLSAGVGFRF